MTPILFAVFSLLAVSGVLSQTEPPISRNPCQSFVCQNGGRCISPVDFPICQCPSGFGGNNCENQVPVKNGTCPADPNVGIVNCRRGCDNDFNCTGTWKCCNTFCERQCTGIARNPCQSFVCQNGGRCISPVGFPICQCPSGFGGNICENQVPVKIGTCPADPTLAILNCNRGCDNDFNCTGTEKCCNTFCERQCTSISRNPCQSFVCQNNGTCISPVDFPICQCPSGFGGNNCENQVPVKIGTCPADPNFGIVNCTRGCDNDFNCTGTEKCCNTICERQCTSISRNPCQSFVCQNGGRCISPVDVPICQCLSGFGGNNCENQVPVKIGTCPTDPNIGIVNCTRGCDNDFNCTGTQKCCNTTCERQCTSISRNPCQSFVCQNNGTCISPVDFPICQCPSGFGGNNCENQVPVKIGKCPTNLTLAILNCNRGCDNDFNCTGTEKCCNTICERQCTSNIIIDPCRGFVCLNGGTCTAPADAASCQCPPGFSGPTCEFSDRPGTCPVIEFIIRMTCVGVPCTSDQQCPSNQKCCTVTCGETLCTDVEPPPTLTCANLRCNVGSVCRNVSTCSSCPIGPTCVPVDQVYDGIDNDCRRQNYTQVVLLENPSNRSEYNQLTCASRFRTCPPGSDCAGGLCCQGKVTIPLTKPGLCPAVPVCEITDCTNDHECPGEQKCCPGCGKSCRDPVFVRNEYQCRNTRCPPGLVCVLRTPVCPPGRSCIQIVIPVCVLPQCVNCTANEDCVPSGSGFVCTTLNQCGGCPLGQVCRPTRRFCLRTPCPQFACVPIDICGECTGGQVCRPISCIVKTLSTLLNFSNNGIGRLIG